MLQPRRRVGSWRLLVCIAQPSMQRRVHSAPCPGPALGVAAHLRRHDRELCAFEMTPEQEGKLAALKGAYLANLAKVREAGSKEGLDRVIAEHVNSYIAEVGNDRELADAILTWLKDPVGW